MTVTLEQECEADFSFDHYKLAKEVVEYALAEAQFPYEAEINLLLVSEGEIRKINREYRESDTPTDVLSFPLITFHPPGDFSALEGENDSNTNAIHSMDNFNPDTGEAMLGDIVLCVPKIKEQAEAFGHSERREYAFLILHSMLHLFGYDHMVPEDAEIMEGKQKEILDKMNILR